MQTQSQSEQQSATSRGLIERELMRRIEKNPRYSLRAFARSLGVSHTALSLVLTGRRRVSKNLATRVADCVGLTPLERQALFAADAKLKGGEPAVHQLELDQFDLFSDWHHYAVLSLLELPHAQFDEKWIAARLTISRLHARSLMDRLLRLGMVVETDGVWKRAVAPIRVNNQVSTAATRLFHQQLLAKAAEVIEQTSAAERNYSSMTFVMDEAQVGLATERIREFRRKLVAELERRGAPTKVYNLTVQLFPAST
jgi:uncharacterized protein (TIGR02147 family)